MYESNISVKPFTDEVIMNLFEWKNGGKLAELKRKSVERNYFPKKEHECVRRAIQFPQSASAEESGEFAKEFLTNDFKEGGEIWPIFWLHCCNQRFPIYDQHVHRAMVFIEEGRTEDLNEFEGRKVEFYITRYLSFHRRFSGEQRKIDKAVHTFGRFIKAWPDLCQRSADSAQSVPQKKSPCP